MNRLVHWSRTAILMAATTALIAIAHESSPAYAATDAGAASKYLEDSKASMAKGDFKTAEIHLKNALRVDPENVDARLALAVLYLRQGLPSAAEGALYPLINSGKKQEQVLPLLGEIYLAQGKGQDVLRVLDAKDLSGEAKAKVQVLRARAYLQEGRTAEARDEIDQALAITPDMPDALIAKAELFRQGRDIEGAEKIADQILSKDPKHFGALLFKGDLRRAQGDPEAAIEYFNKALSDRPDSTPGLLGRAASLLALRRAEEARKDVDAVLARDAKQPLAVFLRASMLAAEGKFEQAHTALQPVAGELENLFAAQVLLTEVNLRLRNIQLANEYALHSYAMAPNSAIARTLLATVHLRRNEPKKAVDLLEPIAPQHEGDDRLQSVLAEAYSRTGRFEEAVGALGNVLKNNPDNADLRARLDANLFQSGRKEEAVEDLNAIVSGETDSRNANILLFAFNVQTGKVSEAAEVAQKLRDSNPDNPLGHYLFGVAHQIMAERQTAREGFEAALEKKPDFMPAATALAKLSMAEGKPDDARRVMEKVVETDPKNASAMTMIADLERTQGKFDDAEEWIEKATAANPDGIDPYLKRVDVLLQRKQPEKALVAANAASGRFPEDLRAFQALARAQAANDNPDGAATTLKRAADLPKNTAAQQFSLGQFFMFLKHPEDARAAWLRATQIDPLHFPSWQELALLDVKEGQSGKALETAKRASATDPSLGEAVKGQVYMALGQYKEADAAFGTALAHRPHGQLANLQVEARKRAGDRPGARKLQETWIAAHPDDDRMRFMYASDLIADNDLVGAVREHETLLKKAPFNPILLNNLAWLYSETGDPKAVEIARRAYAGAPDSPDVADTLGWVLVKEGQLDEAVALLADAHGKSPQNPSIAFHYAKALAEKGEKRQAVDILAPLVSSDKPFGEKKDAEKLLQSLRNK